jgi:hypothetical protein
MMFAHHETLTLAPGVAAGASGMLVVLRSKLTAVKRWRRRR